jgi:hypothetical protein
MTITMSKEEAEQRLARINDWGAAFPFEDVKALYHGRAWRAFGYRNWHELISAEINPFAAKLPPHVRTVVVATLRGAGLSTRAIAPVVGADQSTVVRDLGRRARSDASASVGQTKTVLSLDGRERPATVERHPTPEEEAAHAATAAVNAVYQARLQHGWLEWSGVRDEVAALHARLPVITELDADARAEILAQLPRVRATLDELERRLTTSGSNQSARSAAPEPATRAPM